MSFGDDIGFGFRLLQIDRHAASQRRRARVMGAVNFGSPSSGSALTAQRSAA